MKLHKTILNILEQELDISIIKESLIFLIKTLDDKILDGKSDEEKVALLYSVKILYITYGIKRV